MSIKNPSLHLSSELPILGLCCTSLAVAFPFSLINLLYIYTPALARLPHEPVPWPVKAKTLDTVPNTSNQHVKIGTAQHPIIPRTASQLPASTCKAWRWGPAISNFAEMLF
jgi:hypothetical protein